MAWSVVFRNQTLADILSVNPDTQPAAPPVRLTGVFQQAAALACDSPNFVHAIEVVIWFKEADNFAAAARVAALQALVGQRGRLKVLDGVTVKIDADNWMLVGVPNANLGTAFAGRFTDGLVLRFEGETAARY